VLGFIPPFSTLQEMALFQGAAQRWGMELWNKWKVRIGCCSIKNVRFLLGIPSFPTKECAMKYLHQDRKSFAQEPEKTHFFFQPMREQSE
jgi:hypothetical protein